ncbi:MAG: hypothetical protein ABI563_14815 [Specibacter sp.]
MLLLADASLLLVAAATAAVGLRQVVVSPLGVRTRQKAPAVPWLRLALGGGGAVVLYLVMTALTASSPAAVVIVVLVGVFAAGLALLNLMGPFVLKLLAASQRLVDDQFPCRCCRDAAGRAGQNRGKRQQL